MWELDLNPDPAKAYRWVVQGLKRGNTVIYVENEAGEVVWLENGPQHWFPDLALGVKPSFLLPEAFARSLEELKERARIEGSATAHAVELERSGQRGWFEIWVDTETAPGDSGVYLVLTFIDTTHQMQREQTLRALLRELSHRSKNLLAIILSIATQTSRYTTTTEAFLERFRGRIQSLSSSQDLVTLSNWRGADLHELLVEQVQRYRLDAQRAVHFRGRSVYLTPNAALHVGLALHELTVNSVSFGALGSPEGFVDVEIQALQDTQAGNYRLSWTEETDIEGRGDRERRFGTVALERVVPAAVNGEAELHFEQKRFRYTLTLPANQIERAPGIPTA